MDFNHLIRLLRRLCDNQAKEVMGKIYQRMFDIQQGMEKLDQIEWIEQAKQKHRARWKYLHGPMHAAGYALDPDGVLVQW